MDIAECLQRCMAAGPLRPPPTVNLAPIEEAARMVAMEEVEFGAWMRDAGLNPANGLDAVLAAAAAIANLEYASVEG